MYNTKQRNLILNTLKDHPNTSFSIKELTELLSDVSLATLYRNIDSLAEAEIIRKYYNEVTHSYEYQYIEDIDECAHHLHLKCNVCGKLIHLSCKLTDPLIAHVRKDHKFNIDFNHSVIYGTCKNCMLIK